MNYSKQREIILNALRENVVHPSADYIYNVLKEEYPTISLATVYRNLNKLSEVGAIKKIEGLNDSDHFDHNTHEHYHLICLKCTRIFDIPKDVAPNVCSFVENNLGFKVLDHEITYRGICPECQKLETENED